MTTTPSLTTANGHSSESQRSTSSRMSWLCLAPRRRRPAVALTAMGVHERSFSGTASTACWRRLRSDSAASTGLPLYDDRPGLVVTNSSSSSLGSASGLGSQCEKVYMCRREPVEPASIMMAYVVAFLPGGGVHLRDEALSCFWGEPDGSLSTSTAASFGATPSAVRVSTAAEW